MPDPADTGARVLAALPAAARELGLSVRQLRRDLRNGAPQARAGRRGRGGAALVDVRAIAAWRALQRGATATDDERLRVFVSEIPGHVETAVLETFRGIEGPHKRPIARELAGVWYRVTTGLMDRARCDVPDLADVETLPEKIEQLRHI